MESFFIYLETMEAISFLLFMFILIASMLFTSLLLYWTYKHKFSAKKLPPFSDIDMKRDKYR